MRLINRTANLVIAERLEAPNLLWERMRGLLGRDRLEAGEAMLLLACRWVHTFGMRFPIDVVFLDAHYRVVRLAPDLKPNRLSPFVPAARMTVELPAGTLARLNLRRGDQLAVEG
jgi:uncharacterized membrane protein (UPF0127 family)